jgi:capsular polysaccharide biosynthesis protein
LASLFGALVTFFALISIPKAYEVRTDYLVIQQSASSQDFYTLSKSAEYSGNVLKEAIGSDLFYREAAERGYFDASVFSGSEKDRLKRWNETVSASNRANSGMFQVIVLHDNHNEAVGIARAISDVLIEKNSLFRSGNPEDLSIKRISGPIVERNPDMKELIMGIVAGFFLGGAVFFLWVWYREESDRTEYGKFVAEKGVSRQWKGGAIYTL